VLILQVVSYFHVFGVIWVWFSSFFYFIFYFYFFLFLLSLVELVPDRMDHRSWLVHMFFWLLNNEWAMLKCIGY